MKNDLLIFCLLISTAIYGQVINVTNSLLPIYVSSDTLVVSTPVWVESLSSETAQRTEILSLTRKINTLKDVIKEKGELEDFLIDSLFFELNRLERAYDSVQTSLTTASTEITQGCVEDLNELNNVLTVVRLSLNKSIEKADLLRKQRNKYILITVGQAIIIALMLYLY